MSTSKWPGTTQLDNQRIKLESQVSLVFPSGGGSFTTGFSGAAVPREQWYSAGSNSLFVPAYIDDSTPGSEFEVYLSGMAFFVSGPGSATFQIAWKNIWVRVKFDITFEVYKDSVLDATVTRTIPSDGTYSSNYTLTAPAGHNYNFLVTGFALS